MGATGIAIAVAGPAAAFTADGTATLTATSTNPAVERASTELAGECPTGTTDVTVDINWTDGDGAHTQQAVPTYNAADGTFGDDYFLTNAAATGTAFHLVLECIGAGDAVLAGATFDYSTPVFGTTLSAPATLASDAALVFTVDCAEAAANYLYVTHFDGTGTAELASEWVEYTGPGAYTLGTPASHGYQAGDSAQLRVICMVTSPTTVATASRIASYAVTAPVVVGDDDADDDPPAVEPGAGTLAETGPASWSIAANAAILLVLGSSFILIARRQRTH